MPVELPRQRATRRACVEVVRQGDEIGVAAAEAEAVGQAGADAVRAARIGRQAGFHCGQRDLDPAVAVRVAHRALAVVVDLADGPSDVAQVVFGQQLGERRAAVKHKRRAVDFHRATIGAEADCARVELAAVGLTSLPETLRSTRPIAACACLDLARPTDALAHAGTPARPTAVDAAPRATTAVPADLLGCAYARLGDTRAIATDTRGAAHRTVALGRMNRPVLGVADVAGARVAIVDELADGPSAADDTALATAAASTPGAGFALWRLSFAASNHAAIADGIRVVVIALRPAVRRMHHPAFGIAAICGARITVVERGPTLPDSSVIAAPAAEAITPAELTRHARLGGADALAVQALIVMRRRPAVVAWLPVRRGIASHASDRIATNLLALTSVEPLRREPAGAISRASSTAASAQRPAPRRADSTGHTAPIVAAIANRLGVAVVTCEPIGWEPRQPVAWIADIVGARIAIVDHLPRGQSARDAPAAEAAGSNESAGLAFGRAAHACASLAAVIERGRLPVVARFAVGSRCVCGSRAWIASVDSARIVVVDRQPVAPTPIGAARPAPAAGCCPLAHRALCDSPDATPFTTSIVASLGVAVIARHAFFHVLVHRAAIGIAAIARARVAIVDTGGCVKATPIGRAPLADGVLLRPGARIADGRARIFATLNACPATIGALEVLDTAPPARLCPARASAVDRAMAHPAGIIDSTARQAGTTARRRATAWRPIGVEATNRPGVEHVIRHLDDRVDHAHAVGLLTKEITGPRTAERHRTPVLEAVGAWIVGKTVPGAVTANLGGVPHRAAIDRYAANVLPGSRPEDQVEAGLVSHMMTPAMLGEIDPRAFRGHEELAVARRAVLGARAVAAPVTGAPGVGPGAEFGERAVEDVAIDVAINPGDAAGARVLPEPPVVPGIGHEWAGVQPVAGVMRRPEGVARERGAEAIVVPEVRADIDDRALTGHGLYAAEPVGESLKEQIAPDPIVDLDVDDRGQIVGANAAGLTDHLQEPVGLRPSVDARPEEVVGPADDAVRPRGRPILSEASVAKPVGLGGLDEREVGAVAGDGAPVDGALMVRDVDPLSAIDLPAHVVDRALVHVGGGWAIAGAGDERQGEQERDAHGGLRVVLTGGTAKAGCSDR